MQLTLRQKWILQQRAMSDSRTRDPVLAEAYEEKDLRESHTATDQEIEDHAAWQEERHFKRERLREIAGVDNDRD